MSIKAMSYVTEAYPAGGTKLLALLFIADFCNDDGWAWPSVNTLTAKCRLKDRKHMQDVLDALEVEGWIKRFPRRQGDRNLSNLICLVDYCRFHGIPVDPEQYAHVVATDWEGIESLPAPKERLEPPSKPKPQGARTPQGVQTPQPGGVQTPNAGGPQPPKGRGVQTPRSFNNDPPSDPPSDPKAGQAQLTPQQQMFGVLGVILLGHNRTDAAALTVAQRKLLGVQASRMIQLGATADQVAAWYKNVWRREWPGNKGGKPSINQLHAGIVAYLERGAQPEQGASNGDYSEYSQDWFKQVGAQYGEG